jgi:8-oxo-dGTP pyrophosphatase MutT (NUDIX family)
MWPSEAATAREWIGQRLQHGPEDGWRAHLPPAHAFEQTCPAAVLIPLVWHADGPTVLLTRRSDDLPTHPGQISFPGGKQEKEDAGPEAAALREAEEEIGLDRAAVTVLGCLPRFVTITRFAVTPVVGLIVPPVSVAASPREVAEIFEVPLAHVLRSDHYCRHAFERDGFSGHYLSISHEDHYIWGATAAMLRLLALTLEGGGAALTP